MKFNKEQIENELERLRSKYSYIQDPETGEWIEPKDISNLPTDAQAIMRFSKDAFGLDGWEPTDAEMELGADAEKSWDHFKELVFESLAFYRDGDVTNLFNSFQRLCVSLTELWGIAFYDWETQKCIFSFMKDIDASLYAKIEPQLWFCMYNHCAEKDAKADVLKEILSAEFCKHHPYPGYYGEQAQELIKELKPQDKEAETSKRYNELLANYNALFGLK